MLSLLVCELTEHLSWVLELAGCRAVCKTGVQPTSRRKSGGLCNQA